MTTKERFQTELEKLQALRPRLKKTWNGHDLWLTFGMQYDAIAGLVDQLNKGVLVRDLTTEFPGLGDSFTRTRMNELEEWVRYGLLYNSPSYFWKDYDMFMMSEWELWLSRHTQGLQDFWAKFKAGVKKAVFVEKPDATPAE